MDDQGDAIGNAWLFAIGGGEENEDGRATLRRYVALAGGRDARILVLELGGEKGRGPEIQRILTECGAPDAGYAHLSEGGEAEDETLAAAAAATGFYLLGGGSTSVADSFKGSALGRAVLASVGRGATLAASGGACAYLGESFVTSGPKKSAGPAKGFISLRPGLGLLPGIIFDGVSNPARVSRLLTAVAQNPFYLGIGVDEGTCALFGPDGVLEVFGSGATTVIDGSSIAYSNYFALKEDEPVGLTGVRVSLLVEGMRYDFVQHAYIFPEAGRTHKRISAVAEARALTR